MGANEKDPVSWEFRKREIQSAPPLKLIIMLYEEAIRSLEESKKYIDNFKKYDVFNKKLFKAIDIIKELRLSLDMKQGEIAKNLDSLYEYLGTILVQAGLDKKPDHINESIGILEELLSSWKQIDGDHTSSSNDNVPPQIPRFDSGFSIKG